MKAQGNREIKSSVSISLNLKFSAAGSVVLDRGHCGSVLLDFILLST